MIAGKTNPDGETHVLVRYDEMCRAIAAAYRVDEVKDIRDKAMAIALYAKQANNREAEFRAIQIRVRAERKAGELSKELPRGAGNQHASPHGAEKQKLLADAGISTQQASEWERLADVPAEEFEKAIVTSQDPSARGIVYDHARLHGSDPAVAGKPLTGDDLANALLEGVIREIERLENKYDHIEFVKNTLAVARRTIAAHLIPAPRKKGGGIHIVK
jgi:hypothetical protein